MNCPDAELLSAFVDGEVGSPWSGRIQEHIGECGRCHRTVERFTRLKRLLQEDPEPAFEASYRRTRQRLARQSQLPLAARAPLWRKRISVPFPAVAAGLLAVLVMGAALFVLGNRPSVPFMSITSQPSGVTEVQVAAPIEDLEQLLKSLDQQTGSKEIVINLPEDTRFLQVGEPTMVREEDLGGKARW